jgi:hypothetical protein
LIFQTDGVESIFFLPTNEKMDELCGREFVVVRLSSLFIVRNEVAWGFAMRREFLQRLILI